MEELNEREQIVCYIRELARHMADPHGGRHFPASPEVRRLIAVTFEGLAKGIEKLAHVPTPEDICLNELSSVLAALSTMSLADTETAYLTSTLKDLFERSKDEHFDLAAAQAFLAHVKALRQRCAN